MKLTTAVLAAGAAVSLATAVVGAARLRQDARHQAERNEATVARNQHGCLPFYASKLMESDVCRRYWARFGGLRAQEAEGDERAEHFTKVLDKAAKNHLGAQPVAA